MTDRLDMGSAVVPRLTAALADRYRIERELGAGGMATVYLAQDLKHDRKVAIKVLRPELAAVIGAERFLSEIKTTANLQHPHILPLHDSGQADTFLFYVMPYVEGETLRNRLSREKQIPIHDAIRIATEVAGALDYAHRHGIIHRDIKPENILLHDGRALVADFGIALAATSAGSRMTETGMSLGTPHYMSPEQAMGDRELTPRSDVYALGAMTYEMLLGEPPFTGPTAQSIVAKVMTEKPARLTPRRERIPLAVEDAVLTALEKLPADRFESAAKFAEALANPGFTTGTARSAGLAARPYPWAVLAATLLAGAGLGGAGVRALTRTAAAPVASGREQLTFNGLAGRPAISPDGDFVAFVETSCGHARLSLCRSSLVLQEVGSTQARVLLSDATDLQAPRWSHDGLTLIVAGELSEGREGLFAVPRLTGTPQRIGPRGVYDTHPSADSVMLIPENALGFAHIIAISNGVVADSIPLQFQGASDVSWAPDGRRLAARLGEGLQLFGRDGRPTDSIPVGHLRPVVRWNPGGTAVLFFRGSTVREDQFVQLPVGRDGRIVGPAEVLLDRVPTLYRGSFDIARKTGTLSIETGDANSDLWSFDLTIRPPHGRREARGTTWYGYPAASLDGRFIYYYRGDAKGDNVYARNLETGLEEALTAQSLAGGEAMRLSHDGRRLVYGHSSESGPRLEYLEFPSRQAFSTPAPIWADRVEPVSSRGFVASHDRTGELIVLDSLNGTWRSLVIPDSLNAVNFAGSPDGASLAVVAVSSRASESASVYRAGAGGRRLVVGTVPLSGGAFRHLGTFATGEPQIGVSWENDRTLFLTRWLDADENPSLWRLTIADGRLTRGASIPAACTPVSIGLGGSGRVATCRVDDFRADIWLMTVPGVTR